MDVLMICIFACWGLMVFFFVCYSVTTKNIIRDQEKEIAKLRTSNKRLQAAMKTGNKPVKPDFKEW